MIREWHMISPAPSMRRRKIAEQAQFSRYSFKSGMKWIALSKIMTKLKWTSITIEWLRFISQAVVRSCIEPLIIFNCRNKPMANIIGNIPNPASVDISDPLSVPMLVISTDSQYKFFSSCTKYIDNVEGIYLRNTTIFNCIWPRKV